MSLRYQAFLRSLCYLPFFFFHSTATTELYTLSLHDALPIWRGVPNCMRDAGLKRHIHRSGNSALSDRKSTRLNSSHRCISYAVFCLKKKNCQMPVTRRATTETKVYRVPAPPEVSSYPGERAR